MNPLTQREILAQPSYDFVEAVLAGPVTVLVWPSGGDALAARLLEACAQSGRPVELARSGPIRSGGTVLDITGSYVGRPDQEVWRIRAGSGGLADRFALSAIWHRPPYCLPIVLYRTHSECGTKDTHQTLGVAYVRSAGSLGDLRAKAAATAAILVRRALSGMNSPVEETEATPVVSGPDGASAAVVGWLRWQAARWRNRFLTEWWAVGICDQPIETVLRTGQIGPVRWLRPKPGKSYWADPFWWPGTSNILVEECAVENGTGVIAVLREANDGRWERERLLPGNLLHRSYPYTYMENGQTFILPECVGAGEVVLYRLETPGRMEPVAVIARARLADPTLFRHGGRYWVAATDLAVGAHDNLCLFHADRLEGPWQSHRANPVKIDIRSSRPGGTPFLHEGQLFRPAQDCAASYGAAVVINRVMTLTPDSFVEQPAIRLAPDRHGPLPDGLHTISAAGDRTLIDAKRMVPAPGRAWRQAMRRAAQQLYRLRWGGRSRP